MQSIKNLVEFFRIPAGKPALVVAQVRALSKKTPLMYAIVVTSVLGLAFTHFPYAPIWMTVYVPVVFVAISVTRVIRYRRVLSDGLDEKTACERHRAAYLMSAALSFAFIAWALALTRYGTADTRAHVILFAGATAFGNAASVMHVRSAFVAMVTIVTLPLLAFLALSGNIVYMTMSISVLGMGLLISLVLLDSTRDFEKLVESGVELEKERAAAQDLSRAYLELASIDPLTGLMNRRGFLKELEELLDNGRPTGPIAMAVLDLDGFKPVNDIYGHPAGDRVLKEVGKRLVGCGGDMIASRLGGDEFGLIISGFRDEAELIAYGETICERMRVPFRMDGFAVQMSGSIGLAIVDAGALDSEELLKRADHALYHAKQSGNGSTVLFSEALAERIRESMGVERHLRDANLDQEMSLSYQFVYDSDLGGIVGAEALARWDSPALGPVPPSTFIRAAERSGMIGQLTEVLFRKMLAEFGDWPNHIFVSFNLSAHDICAPERILKLISIAERKGVDPKRLTFEITETAVMHDFERAQESLALLKRFGARIALDDFGTGHSSLSYVHTLPLDRVKVDRSFVAEIENSAVTRAVVQTILELCTSLSLDCIIEGVETKGQLDLMQQMGCTTFQGFLFSKPLDGVSARRFLVASGNSEPPAERKRA